MPKPSLVVLIDSCRPMRQSAILLTTLVLLGSLFSSAFLQATAPAALNFNGTNAQVQVPDSPGLRIPTNLTVEAWIKPALAPDHRHAVGKSDYTIAIKPKATGFGTLMEGGPIK